MCICIKTKSGQVWYTEGDDVLALRQQIDQGQTVRVWWFTGWGQRFTETLWVSPDELAYVITESDDG